MFKLLVCCIFLFLSVSESQQSVLQKVKDSEYYVSSITGTFLKAFAICKEFGLKLATVPNGNIQNALNETTNSTIWLGAMYLTYDGIFKPRWLWMDTGNQLNYTNWKPGEPSYYSNILNCLTMLPTGLWYVARCETDSFYFVCSVK